MIDADILAEAMVMPCPSQWDYTNYEDYERDGRDWDILFQYHRDEADITKAKAAAEVIIRRYNSRLEALDRTRSDRNR